MALAERHGLAVVEDAAQSIGSRYDGRPAGSFGHIGCFSAHPLKNLNAAGDAGFLTTGDEQVARRVRLLRNHGLIDRNTVVEFGTVSRLDGLQAEILRFRLSRLPAVIERRRANAARYRDRLAGLPVANAPCRAIEFNTFHVFVIQADRRDALQAALAEGGIGTGIHYPVPIHLQPAAAGLGYPAGSMPAAERQAGRILSLPINQYVTAADIDYVAELIGRFTAGPR
jgi:dTDP-4-amino-4,6-dideoxygalactose transaminase